MKLTTLLIIQLFIASFSFAQLDLPRSGGNPRATISLESQIIKLKENKDVNNIPNK